MKELVTIASIAILMIAFTATVVISSAEKDRKHAEFMDSMTYCERLDYRLERQRFTNGIQALALEKMAAYQSGQCPQK